MEIEFHRRVQRDLNEALGYYDRASDSLGDDFYNELMEGVAKVRDNPKICHFDSTGLTLG